MLDFTKLARKITWVLFANQSLTSAAFIAASTINSILGAKLGGSAAYAVVPSGIYLLGGAFAASAWGYLMDKIGRRNGIVLGLVIGALGSAVVLYAIAITSLIVFLIGMVMIGMDELAGAYMITLILFVIAAIVVFAGLRPDPRDLGREIAAQYPEETPHGATRSIGEILRQPAALMAVTAMVLGQVVMVAIMVITSLDMRGHNHNLRDISAVISSHTFGMYAFSVLSGRLSDKWGRGRVILTGSVTLLLACITAPLSPNVLPLAVSLFLLGLGWNFCFVGGSALLADQLSPAESGSTQGTNDLLVGLASASGSLGSGFLFAASNYTMITIVSGVLSLVPLTMALLWMRKTKITAVTA